MAENCTTGQLQILDAGGCPIPLPAATPPPAFVTINAAGQVCTNDFTAGVIPALNPNNIAGGTNVQAQLDFITARLGSVSTMRAGALVGGIVGSHIHNSGQPGAADYTIDIRAQVLPFDTGNCALTAGNNNVQGAIDALCTAILAINSHPSANIVAGSNPALSLNFATQGFGLNLNAAGSYDTTTCAAVRGVAMPTSIQGAITNLCTQVNALTVHPAATVNAASNPALTIDPATQVANLNLTTAGSYDNALCTAVRGTPMPTDVQGAITTLCTAINALAPAAGTTSSLTDGPATAAGTQTKIHSNGATPAVTVQFCEGFDTITRTDTCPVVFDDARRLVSDITFAGKTFQMTRIPDHTSICGRTNLGQPSQEFSDPREAVPPGAIAAPTPAASGGGAVANILITNDGALVIQNPSTCRTMRVELTAWDRVRFARYTDNASSTAEGESTALSNVVTLVRVNGGAYQSAGQTRDQTVNRPPGERDYYSSQDKTGPQPICFDIAPGGAATIDTAMGLTHFGAGNGNWSWHSFLYNNPGFTWKGTTV